MDKYTSIGAYYARGLVIILMVYGHITFIGESVDFQKVLYDILHSFRMPVLIFLTGYFIDFSKSSKKSFDNTIRRILVPYLFFEVLYILMHVTVNFLGLINTNTPPVASFSELLNTVFIDPTGPFWFLYYLSVVQLWINFLRILNFSNQNYFLLLSGAGLFLLSFFGLLTLDFVVFYFLGVVFRKFYFGLDLKFYLSFFILIVFYYLGAADISSDMLIRIPFVISIVFFACWLGNLSYLRKINNAVIQVGANSISVLCWHAFIIVMFRPFSSYFLTLDSTGLFYSIFVTFSGVLFSILITIVFDRLDVSRYVFGVKSAYKKIEL